MILVSGTGRSGTSMWMQALGAAGFERIGDAFPLNWGDLALRGANRLGFYESTLIEGINFTTNPNPETGATLDAERCRDVACKVFLRALPRTERRWLTRVVATFRHYSTFRSSLARIGALLRVDDPTRPHSALTFHPYARWWNDHYVAATDVAGRGYPCRWVAYEDVLADPSGAMAPVLEWIGVPCDVDAAVRVVTPALRTQTEAACPDLPPAWVEPFEELYAHLRDGRASQPEYLARAARFHEEVRRKVANDPLGPRDPWALRAR